MLQHTDHFSYSFSCLERIFYQNFIRSFFIVDIFILFIFIHNPYHISIYYLRYLKILSYYKFSMLYDHIF